MFAAIVLASPATAQQSESVDELAAQATEPTALLMSFSRGLFAQTFFSFAGKDSAPSVGVINLPPICSYQLGEGRSLSLGNSALISTRTTRAGRRCCCYELRPGGELMGTEVAAEFEASCQLRDLSGSR